MHELKFAVFRCFIDKSGRIVWIQWCAEVLWSEHWPQADRLRYDSPIGAMALSAVWAYCIGVRSTAIPDLGVVKLVKLALDRLPNSGNSFGDRVVVVLQGDTGFKTVHYATHTVRHVLRAAYCCVCKHIVGGGWWVTKLIDWDLHFWTLVLMDLIKEELQCF